MHLRYVLVLMQYRCLYYPLSGSNLFTVSYHPYIGLDSMLSNIYFFTQSAWVLSYFFYYKKHWEIKLAALYLFIYLYHIVHCRFVFFSVQQTFQWRPWRKVYSLPRVMCGASELCY